MSLRDKLEEFEAATAASKEEKRIEAERARLKKAVREVLPQRLLKAGPPERPRGRTPPGGVGKREVLAMRARAKRFLSGPAGLAELEEEVKMQALTILQIDGVLGTEPWRGHGGHSGIIAANARLRYLENASRILADIRRGVEGQDEQKQLTDGVFDAEVVEDSDGDPTPQPQGAEPVQPPRGNSGQ